MARKKITYGKLSDEFVVVESLSDELRFVECMKLYKSHPTLESLDKALTPEAKEKIKKLF